MRRSGAAGLPGAGSRRCPRPAERLGSERAWHTQMAAATSWSARTHVQQVWWHPRLVFASRWQLATAVFALALLPALWRGGLRHTPPPGAGGGVVAALPLA